MAEVAPGKEGKPFRGRSRRVKRKAAPESSEQQWLRLWSVARYDLGLTDEEFYSLTPRQLDALIKRKERETEAQEFMLAQLTAVTANYSMCRPKEPVSTADFMPSQWGNQRPRKRPTKAQMKAAAERLHRGFTALAKIK